MGCFGKSKNKKEKSEKKEQQKRDKAEAKVRKASEKAEGTKTVETEGYSKIVRWKVGTTKGWCTGCYNSVGGLFDRWKSNGKVVSVDLTVPIVFHDGFQELDNCCEQCLTCRVFRQALLLRQTSADDYNALYTPQKVFVSLARPDDAASRQVANSSIEVFVKISCGSNSSYASTAMVACTMSGKDQVDLLELTPYAEEVIDDQEMSSWLSECEQHHGKACGRLNWSNRNPTRLIEIRDAKNLRLVEGAQLEDRTKYMALSYMWGGKASSNTTHANVKQRMSSLSVFDLLATQRDAIELARKMQVGYVWIDAICIIQDSAADWGREATLMHEYYGNAYFTLCVSSSLHADEGFLAFREAWKYIQLDCEIRGVQLLNVDTSLDEARMMSPHATRAWTLQEEYLSPRRLYWFRSGVYWGCAADVHAEGITARHRRPRQGANQSSDSQLLGRFLLAAFKRHTDELHSIWLGVVESYARRILTQPGDKFKAISGVASRCWNDGDRYMAGLWADTFAIELVWKLDEAKTKALSATSTDPNAPKPEFVKAPSWSWASLPANSNLRFKRGFTPADDFALLESNDDGIVSKSQDATDEHIQQGSEVQQVAVRGRIREFWSADSKRVPWDDVSSPIVSPVDPFDIEDISFGAYRGDDAYSVCVTTGKLAMAEKRTQEIIGQLDYVEDASLVAKGELIVECMEVGIGAMLLVVRAGEEGSTYRRVGACHKVRPDFFNGRTPREVILQ